jgi:hypothetical protein
MRKTEDYLIETADRCTRLAQAGRQIADELETMSNALMAKAVELDVSRQRDEGHLAQPRKASTK